MPKISEEAKNERVQIILDHAFKLFSKKGYSNTTVDDIVQASGISKGGIYTYFRGKQEIFIAIAENRFSLRKKMVQELQEDLSSIEKIKNYLNWILSWVSDEKNSLQIKFTTEFWSVSSRDKELMKVSKDRYERFSKDLKGILIEGVERGEFKEALDIDAMVYLILASTDSIGFMTGVMGIKADNKVCENLISMICNHLIK